MSLGDLAQVAQIAKSYLSKVERGEALNIGLATLGDIASALDTTIHDLLPRGNEEDEVGPAEQARETVRFEMLADSVPVALQAFLAEEAERGAPVPEDTARALAVLKLRGQRPETKDDYRLLYAVLRRVI
jgi:transcriptional regulator with XRE-family HTH domain